MDRKDTANRSFRPSIPNRDNYSSNSTAFRFEAQASTPDEEIAYVERSVRAQGQGISRAPRVRPPITSVFPDAHLSEQDDERRSTSNELSYSQNNARDSLVHQILMSLDSAAPDVDDSSSREQSHSIWGNNRQRGHTHSSSTSSAFFRFARDRSRSQSRGRHTKNKSSGSDFQSTLGRIQSVRTTGQQTSTPRPELSSSDPRPSTQGKSRQGTNLSPDNRQAAGQQRRTARRSISFDQGHSRTFSGSTIRQVTMDSDRDPASDYDGIEASRTTSSSTSAQRQTHNGSIGSMNAQALRPSRSNAVGLRKPGTSPQRPIGGADGSMQAAEETDDGVAAASIRERTQAPPIPRTIRHKPEQSNSYKAMAFSPNATVGKEKGGFFKRMFGGSSKSTATTDSQAQTKPASASIRNDSYQSPSEESTASPAQQTGAVAPNGGPRPEPKEPSLNKKASFFRRRKKSVAAPAPAVPSLPSNANWQESTAPSREQSPASSLRKVMNPYLANSRPGTRTGRAASKTAAGESLAQQHEVRLFPMQDAGHEYVSESSSHAHPVPSPQPMSRQRSAQQDGPDRNNSQHRDQPAPAATRSDDAPQNSEFSERVSRRKTLTTTSPSGAPTRSSSKGWRDRPQNRAFPLDQSRRSTSGQRRPDITRTETDASEVSDSDFTSAKSQVISPVEDKEPEFSRPPPFSTAAPPVHSMAVATPVAAATSGERDESVLTPETAKLRIGNSFISTLDPARTPTYVSQDLTSPAQLPGQDAEDRPSDEDHAIAEQLFRFNADVIQDEASLPKYEDEICAWLGEAGEGRARIRTAYLEMFDWKDTSILVALRKFCEHVKLKGETQQVDRILEGIARRWTECNPSHGFKAVDVIHTICYSLILLNTDLHIADIENRMTRGQFVKNTMQTVLRVVDDAAPDAFKQSTINAAKRASAMPPPKPSPLDLTKQTLSAANSTPASPNSPKAVTSPNESGTVKLTVRRNSNEFQRGKFRLSARPSDNTALEALLGEAKNREPETHPVANEDCGPLVKQQFFGGRAAWETQIETVLKNFYNGIQKQRLPLQGSDAAGQKETSRAPSSLGQNTSGNKLGRTPSISSRQSGGERGQASRPTTGTTSRWRNKMAQRPRIYAASNFSVDDDMSMAGASPSASSMWSKYSLGRTQTSMSVTSFRSEAPGQEAYQQSIGFANALSQAIIREENDGADGDEKDGEALKAASLLDDDGLELYGAPWAKEGIVKHKHHLESVDKKAKERAWTECFAVIQKGWLQLFRFNSSKTASIRARAMRAAVGGVGGLGGGKGAAGPGGKVIVGGGNWMDNALPLGRFLLRQTIASALPPPGYSKSRPHVWALSLPNGAVHLFQAGTPEIVREYVTCANYWSARLSKEPLVGGVSNVEYGWSENLLNTGIIAARPGSRTDGAPSSMAEALAMSRERSASSESSAAPAPGVPRTSSRSVTGGNRPPSAMHSARPSLQNSIRNSFDTTASAVIRPRLPGDRANLHDWQPPQQSMVASALMEVDQLRVLSDYVGHITRELEKHNELRPAIQMAYGQRHPNFGKAMSNFEKKSAYLLREIVKFNTYVEALQTAQTKKEEVLKERDERKKEMEADRAKEDLVKVETAEELRRELSRSDLRLAANVPDVPDVPALPDTGTITKP